jgi:hypothetical protein
MPPLSVWPGLLPLARHYSSLTDHPNLTREGLLSNSGQFGKELSRKHLIALRKERRGWV